MENLSLCNFHFSETLIRVNRVSFSQLFNTENQNLEEDSSLVSDHIRKNQHISIGSATFAYIQLRLHQIKTPKVRSKTCILLKIANLMFVRVYTWTGRSDLRSLSNVANLWGKPSSSTCEIQASGVLYRTKTWRPYEVMELAMLVLYISGLLNPNSVSSDAGTELIFSTFVICQKRERERGDWRRRSWFENGGRSATSTFNIRSFEHVSRRTHEYGSHILWQDRLVM